MELIYIMLIVVFTSEVVIGTDHPPNHDHSVLCRRCGHQLADPSYLSPAKLAPSPFDEANRNLTTLFGKGQVPLQHLVNPAGVEFDLVLFEKAGCRGVGEWLEAGTWFPGHPWRVCVCPKCSHHVGWMYEPEDMEEESTDSKNEIREKPSDMGFYGLILDKLIDEAYASTLLAQPKPNPGKR